MMHVHCSQDIASKLNIYKVIRQDRTNRRRKIAGALKLENEFSVICSSEKQLDGSDVVLKSFADVLRVLDATFLDELPELCRSFSEFIHVVDTNEARDGEAAHENHVPLSLASPLVVVFADASTNANLAIVFHALHRNKMRLSSKRWGKWAKAQSMENSIKG